MRKLTVMDEALNTYGQHFGIRPTDSSSRSAALAVLTPWIYGVERGLIRMKVDFKRW